MTGLNSLAYSASHAQNDAIYSLAKDRGKRLGDEGWGEDRCQDAVSACSLTREGEMGRGDTAQLRLQKRARAQVSPLISALAKNMQI